MLVLLDLAQSWIAVFTGETGTGDHAVGEEAHNIEGDTDKDRIANALAVWDADLEQTEVTVS